MTCRRLHKELENCGPFEVICGSSEASYIDPYEPPRRKYGCEHYETCLDLAAAMDWKSFTCRGCTGVVDEHLLWRAQQKLLKDRVAKSICDLPALKARKVAL